MSTAARLTVLLLALLALAGSGARAHAAACSHADAVFYSTDSLRLAQRLAANRSSCTDYYISVTPTADGSPRANVAPSIRGNGAQFHAMPEIKLPLWAAYVQQTGSSWYDAGVTVRRRMVTAGFDVAAGDTWAINEVGTPSGAQMALDVFDGTGTARQDLRDFVRGLYTGDPGMPPASGLVFAANPPQLASNVAAYESGLRSFLADGAFWGDMSKYVRFWAQETYADARAWGAAGTSLADRTSALQDYLDHGARLARVDPDASPEAKAFFASAYTPVGNASFAYGPPELNPGGIGFGYTAVPPDTMQSFLSSQVYALRTSSEPQRYGFAWSPKTSTAPAATFVSLADRLAASISGSDADPAGACGPSLAWCGANVDGAAFTAAWRPFSDVTPPVVTSHVDGPVGENGWYTGDVTVRFDVSDPESDPTTTGCDTVVVAEDTAGVTYTCTATSIGGTSSAQVTVKRDATPPVLTVPSAITVDADTPAGAAVTYAVAATDALDPAPVVQCAPEPGLFPVGTTRVDCTATDAAGNEAAASFSVHVEGVAEQLDDLAAATSSASLRHGTATALGAILRTAADAAAAGRSVCPHLDAYTAVLGGAERAGLVPAGVAEPLLASAATARAAGGC
ncbi:MAG TPA: HYR domain-containing protein [Gaiellaceae bacterium]